MVDEPQNIPYFLVQRLLSRLCEFIVATHRVPIGSGGMPQRGLYQRNLRGSAYPQLRTRKLLGNGQCGAGVASSGIGQCYYALRRE